MKFSLITATLGRVSEFERLLQSLSAQTFKDFELIVVDQNEHFQLEEICNRFKNLNIKYIHSDKKGLSLNRNIGLKYAVGEIVGFPDDDCYYDDNLLEKVAEKFDELPEYKLVAVEVKDYISGIIWRKKIKNDIYRADLHKCCCSINFFIKKNPQMLFDEKLGVGAQFGAGEETDLLWENFSKTDKGTYAAEVYAYHLFEKPPQSKAYSYGLGEGAIYKKEIVFRHNYFMLFQFWFSLIKTIGAIVLKKPRIMHYNVLKGKILGFYMYK